MRRRFPLSRAEYEATAGANLARPAWYKPALRPLVFRGIPVLVKDFRPCPLPWRLTWGRLMVARECAIYAALAGLPGIPRFLGRLDADAIAVERVEGRDLSHYRKGTLPAGFVDRLETVVRGLHERGVVHLDLRQRRNILVAAGEAPVLIDFASALRLPKGSALLRVLAVTDRSGVAKLRRKHAPDTLSDDDRRLLRLQSLRPLKAARTRRRASRPKPGARSA
jgi:hypothetical protein